MQGASPLASPRLTPRGTGSPCRCGKLNGGLPRRCRLGECQRYPAGAQGGSRLPTLPLRCSQGGLPALSPAYATFSLLFCPYPPSPLPGGKGETLGCFMQGASPLASPRLNPRGTGSLCRCGKLNGGLPRAALARPANPVPGGGRRGAVARRPCRCGVRRGACLLCRLPTLPLACFSAPIPPAPFPAGRGRL